jgi:hypothetical protein
MLVKIARLIIIFLTVLTLAIFLPDFYWKAFDQHISRPFAQYSPLLEDFVVLKSTPQGLLYYDTKGNHYSRSEADSLLPLASARQLIFEGRFPDSLRGIKIEPEDIRINNLMIRISPTDINQQQVALYPLLESQSGRVRLEMPGSFFRIADRMEFINCKDNTLDEELSVKFSNALLKEGFRFPATLISGNPTTRKPFDEGYFIIDFNNHLYHLKMVKGEPFVRLVNVPVELKIEHILVQEMNLREFYALLITSDSRLFIVGYDHYQLTEIPVASYDWNHTDVRIFGDLFYRNVMSYNTDGLTCQVSDRNYQLLDQYQEIRGTRYQREAGKFSECIFPFTLQLLADNTMFVGFYLKPPVMRSLAGIGLFLLLTLILLRYRKLSLKRNWLELLLVLLSGIFGFIAIVLYPPLRDKF